mmetsp:Transcript_21273/g.25321  ORF Transcript_21273/g.25321 Transcript_21273/m.25321 type:complete len:252 (+) Transcript_21273:133-888(+)|eukprot:CAMPEP_0198269638 /NCGR_PEP_ID=MMETSP1447-20131203/42027_1 /TAXON_ID=420782 /ORGANISM="Chaetoceros dichaeta, Strain CCMP1751" /LENGTH=251 /DNA_ID=CAMNT_0043961291 /DNA_START=104 /DNA_END=859 /DNA_ORIENTATION=-
MTALKTRAAPQFEVLLKLKQSYNEEFAFLQADNELNLYYLWLKEGGQKSESLSTHNVKQGVDSISCKKSNNSDKEKNSMGAILEMYSSSSATDESDDDDNYCESTLPIVGEEKNLPKDKPVLEMYSSSSAVDESDDDDDDDSCQSTLLLIIEEKKISSKDKADSIMDMVMTNTSVNALGSGDVSQGATNQDQLVSTNSMNLDITKMDEEQQTIQKNTHKSSSTLNIEQKARRLKRAKLMKGHFVLKMMDSK